jgi:hypothetical protein
MYANGDGVPEDAQKAVHWYTKAAEAGSAVAMFNIGLTYYSGDGVPKDAQKAVHWFTKAAEAGYADAMVNLGIMYVKGDGVIADYVKAYAYCNVAVALGSDRAKALRDLLQKSMTREQIAEAQKLSAQMFEKLRAKPHGD